MLWSQSEPADAGDDQIHAAAFGRGLEPRTLETREITPEEAAKIIEKMDQSSVDLFEILPDDRPPLDFTKLRTYRCVAKNGTVAGGPFSLAAWCDAAFVQLLAELDLATV